VIIGVAYVMAVIFMLFASRHLTSRQVGIWMAFSPLFISVFTWAMNSQDKFPTRYILLAYGVGLLGNWIIKPAPDRSMLRRQA
jgi:drug/metabolite transporter (DMT)-like permease